MNGIPSESIILIFGIGMIVFLVVWLLYLNRENKKKEKLYELERLVEKYWQDKKLSLGRDSEPVLEKQGDCEENMGNAEMLLENAIEAIKRGRSAISVLENDTNSKMIAEINRSGGIRAGDFISMAMYVVHDLYGGKFPDEFNKD